jgi:ureidoglycolate lyase
MILRMCTRRRLSTLLTTPQISWAGTAGGDQHWRQERRWLGSFTFTEENFRNPELAADVDIVEVPLAEATDEALEGFGFVIHSPDEVSVENGNFEIVQWPQPGWRQLDPGTGDEAGTTEGDFKVWWEGDFFRGTNLAVATTNNVYLDGLGAPPADATTEGDGVGDGSSIYLWMSDYHPDGGQLFFPREPIPFTVCLGKAEHGDDIRPEHMRAFAVPAGKGVYFHPGTWHNGVCACP